MEELVFGPAGIPKSLDKRSSLNGVKYCKELGLGAMELEFVHGVRMGENTAKDINEAREEVGTVLTAHGPYYINLNAEEDEKRAASRERVYKTAKVADWCGAYSITFHPGYYLSRKPEEVYETIKLELQKVVNKLQDEDINVWIRPELTGSPKQMGDLPEIIRLSQEIDQVLPCIDFSHKHARNNGGWNNYDKFSEILEELEKGLGRDVLDNMHCHISGIEYGEKGEQNHVNLKESDLEYEELLQALKDFSCKGVVISESPNLEGDAQMMQEIYRNI